jgi:hypothetical protein
VTRRPLAWVRLRPAGLADAGGRGADTAAGRLVRVLIEASVLAVGWLLGRAVGIGTVLFAFGIGPTVELAFRLLRVQVPAGPDRPASGRERTCAES